ncbi:procathepsin L-like [Dreissena polymorpha]|uniref:Cathepsin L n=1 Tax=Dreissena polymorpha TaxID=45954 RepID=A0A9D4BXY3_DREPO|nr:procathepsin L-like [Dreissena polymorpha]KAH3713020.1 hypothetical protein DPMN_072783 [Dreissena polymorpha]
MALLKSMVVLAAGLTFAAGSAEFSEFMTKYGKVYRDATEHYKRMSIWRSNLAMIERHNVQAAKGHHSYTMAMNQFGDMTAEEVRSTMFGYRQQSNQLSTSNFHSNLTALPASVDWKAKGYVTAVGNQGQCGSCWAFTATAALEGLNKKVTGKLVALSVQNLMDCSSKQGNQGCSGGLMDQAFTYVKVNGGIDTDASYPYNQSQPGSYKCRYNKAQIGAKCKGYVDLPRDNETALQYAVAEIGIISTAIDASHTGFMYYKSGVYDEPACNPDQIDHSLAVVGYGVENGVEFYNCKNSWGTEWGEAGFVKVVRNKNNQCGIATEASYPTM